MIFPHLPFFHPRSNRFVARAAAICAFLAGVALRSQAEEVHSTSPTHLATNTIHRSLSVERRDAVMPGGPAYITFSEVPYGSTVTDQYSYLGVLFSGSGDTFTTDDGSDDSSPVLSGTPLFVGSIIASFVNPLDPTQPALADNVSFKAGYFDDLESTRVTWLDINGNAIGTALNEDLGLIYFTAPGPVAGFIIEIIGYEAAGYAIDNVSFQIEVGQVNVTYSKLDGDGVQYKATDGVDDPLMPVKSADTLLAEAQDPDNQVQGLVADGVTPLLVHINLPGNQSEQQFQISLDDDDLDGNLYVLQDGNWSQGSTLTITGTDGYACITGVRAEDLFYDGTPEIPVQITVSPMANPSAGGSTTFALRPPPVILVHGYNADSTTWSSDFLNVLEANVPDDFVIPINYGVSKSFFGGNNDEENTSGALALLAQTYLDPQLDCAIQDVMANWACTRYDAVGHSQGGLLLRMLCQTTTGGSAPFATRAPVSEADFYRGRFYHVVTIGSPHNGTTLLRYWLDRKNGGAPLENLVSFFTGLIQEKFDPFGSQIANANSQSYQPNGQIKSQEIVATIGSGLPPEVGATSPLVFLLTDLSMEAGSGSCIPASQSDDSAGQLIVPYGSDGIVDFYAQQCGYPDYLGTGVNLAHADVTFAFIEAFGVPSGHSETAYAGVAQEVVNLLGGGDWGSFVLPTLLPSSEECLIDDIANNTLVADAEDRALLLEELAVVGLLDRKKDSLSSNTPSPNPTPSSQCFDYSITNAGNASIASVIWMANLYSTNGVTDVSGSTNGVTLRVTGTNDVDVTVCVETDVIGVVVLQPLVLTANSGSAALAPIVVWSNFPAKLTNIQIDPNPITSDIGDTVHFTIVGLYSNGLMSQLYIPSASNLVWTSTRPTVFTVDTNSVGHALAAGAATLTANYGGFSAQATVTVKPVGHVFIVDAPASLRKGEGRPATFSVRASGTGPLRYQWFFNNTALKGATSSSYSIASVKMANAGSYDVVVANASSSATSAVATLTVLLSNQLYIVTQPRSQTNGSGQEIALSVKVASVQGGSKTPISYPAYQWYLNSNIISGATSSTYTPNSPGSYYVIVTNSTSSVTSAVAFVSLVTYPQIQVQPANQFAECGSYTSLTVSAVGAVPLYYQWYLGSKAIAGGTDSTLNIESQTVSNTGSSYYVLVHNNYGSVTSQVVTVTTGDSLAPVITLNDGVTNYVALGTAFADPGASAKDLCAGVLPVTVSGSVNANSNGAYILTYSAADPSGNIGSSKRTVIVNPVVISSQPSNTLVKLGGTATFSVVAQSTNSALQYQWFSVNGRKTVKLSGGTGAVLNINSVTAAKDGGYEVVVTDPLPHPFSVTSIVAQLLVGLPPAIKTQPVSRMNQPVGGTVHFAAQVNGTPPLSYQWLSDGVLLGTGSEFAGRNTNVLTVSPVGLADAASYSLIVTNLYGSITSSPASLTVVTDGVPPTISITNPPADARQKNPILAGTASDNAQVTGVSYWLTNLNNGTNVTSGQATLGAGSSNRTWIITSRPSPGTNILAVQSQDYAGHNSPIVTRRFFYSLPAALNVIKSGNGNGVVTTMASVRGEKVPATNALLNIGEAYTVTAVPGKNSLFKNWSGTLSGTNPVQTFIMETGAEANPVFITNFFLSVGGPFNGLFSIAGNVTEATAGMLGNLVLSSSGAFSAVLDLAGASYPLKGVFNSAGYASNSIARDKSAGGPVSVQLTLNSSVNPAQMTGYVSGTNNGEWTATLIAYPNTTNTTSAQYTMLLAPSDESPAAPAGYGYALLARHAGMVAFAGALADGTPFTPAAPESVSDQLPVYASLYNKTGLVLGWISLESGAPTGTLYWVKPPSPSGALFPKGFSTSAMVQGSPYLPPSAGHPALSLTNGLLSVSGGFLNGPLSFHIAVANNNALTDLGGGSTNLFSGSINPKNGLLNITFGNGNGAKTTSGVGAVLQNSSQGGGYFLGTTNVGQIMLGP